MRTSGRRSRTSSTVSSVRRSLDSMQITAAAPAIPASYSGSVRCAAARELRDPPAAHHAREALVGLVVEHHDAGAGEMQLLDRAQTDLVEPADDHVADPVPAAV
jgi:hypothetical protein